MRKYITHGLCAVNAVLFAAILTVTPAPLLGDTSETGWLDCCQRSTEGEGFCCNNCCWFTHDCNQSSECGGIGNPV